MRFVEAGADCVFVPGVVEEDTIRDSPWRPGAAQRGGGAGEHDRRAHPLLARSPTGQSGRQPGSSRAHMLERAGRELLETGTLGFPRRCDRLRRDAEPVPPVIAVLGGHGKTGRAVGRGAGRAGRRGARAGPGRTGRPLAAAVAGCSGGVRHRAEPAPRRAGLRRGGPGRTERRPACRGSSTTRWPRRTSPRCRTTWARRCPRTSCAGPGWCGRSCSRAPTCRTST